jgi:hypothetical protein
LFDRACGTFTVNETEVLSFAGEHREYNITPAGGSAPLKFTLVYTDPPANLSSMHDRVNDISLQVFSQSGVVYWGNVGLTSGTWSQSGGSRDLVNNVQNVFIPAPVQAGTWKVKVNLNTLVADAMPETGGLDVDFALVVSGVPPVCASHTGDWDHDGTVEIDDFQDFLVDYFRGAADCNTDGRTDSRDVFDFIEVLLASHTASVMIK